MTWSGWGSVITRGFRLGSCPWGFVARAKLRLGLRQLHFERRSALVLRHGSRVQTAYRSAGAMVALFSAMQASTVSAESGCAARRAGGGGRGWGSCGVSSNRSRDREYHRWGTGSGAPPYPVAKGASHPIAQCLQGFCLCSRPIGAHGARHPHPETLCSTCGDVTCEAPRCKRISAVVPKFLCCSNQEACRRQ